MQQQGRWAGYAFVGPFLLFYVCLLIYPLLSGIVLSFFRADLFGGGTFVGFDNYARLFADSNFIRSVLNTFALALMIVPLLTAIALALALALNRATRSAAVFRGIFFSSSVLSVTIVTLIWRFVLAPDAGLLGEAAQALGAEPIPFLSHPTWSLWALALTTIWWSIGLPMMLFLAGLQQIPGDIYEAAALDRASRWTTFRRVTLPLSRPGIVSGSVIVFAWTLSAFATPELLGGGRVKMIANVVRDLALDSFNWPGGAAFALMALVITLALLAGAGKLTAVGGRGA